MSIYNLKSIEPNRYAMAKFSEDFEVEAVYELEPGAHHGYSCTCPAGSRKVRIKPCKHVKMMTVMMGAVNTDRFYDPVTGRWSQPLSNMLTLQEHVEDLGQGMMQTAEEIEALPDGAEKDFQHEMQEAPGHTDLMISPKAIDEATKNVEVPEEQRAVPPPTPMTFEPVGAMPQPVGRPPRDIDNMGRTLSGPAPTFKRRF